MLEVKLSRMSDDARLALCVCVVLFHTFIYTLLFAVFTDYMYGDTFIRAALRAILILIFLLNIKVIVKRFNIGVALFLLSSLLIVFLDYYLFPDLREYLVENNFQFWMDCVPPVIVVSSIRDYSALRKMLTKSSYIMMYITTALLLCVFGSLIPSFNNNSYCMAFGFSCTVPAVFLSIDAFDNNKKALFGVLVFIVAIVVLASRGPLIAILSSLLYFSLRKLVNKGKYFQALTIVVLMFAVFALYKPLLLYFGDVLEAKGMQTRVVSTLTEDSFHWSGRDLLYEQLLSMIKDAPFEVRGIYAEWSVIGGYAHNIFIELLFQFGVILGGIGIVFILINVIRSIFVKTFGPLETLRLVFMFSSLSILLVSRSLWTTYTFWIWMSFCFKKYNATLAQ